MDKVYEKLGFFNKIKNRMARGVVLTFIFYVIFLLILLATCHTNFSLDVVFLWVAVPSFYLAVVAAIATELSWSASAFFAKKGAAAAAEIENQKLKEEGV